MILRLVLGIVAVILLVAIGLFIFRQIRPNNIALRSSPTPTPTNKQVAKNTPTSTPTPAPQISGSPSNLVGISGNVTQIVGKTEYKNSTVIKVGTTDVYLTKDTQIVDNNNQPIDQSSVQPGTYVEVTGTPFSQGIEAAQIKLPNGVNLPYTGGHPDN